MNLSLYFTEFKLLTRLALPIAITQFTQTANGFIDTLMAGKLSATDLAGVALGSSIWLPIYLLTMGTLLGLTPTIGHLAGEKRTDRIPFVTQQALFLAGGAGIAGGILTYYSGHVLSIFGIDESLIPITRDYLQSIAFGFPAVALFTALRAFSEGLHTTKPIMVISLCGLIANVPLNYLFMYGLLGFPAMGGAGCGAATAIVMWGMCISLLLYIKRTHLRVPSGLFSPWHAPQLETLKELSYIGLPIGLAIFFETSIFSVIALFLGKHGEIVVSSHQIALNFASLIFMLPLSVAMALTIRVSHALGEKNYTQTKHICQVGLLTNISIAIVSCCFIVYFRFDIAKIYTDTPLLIEQSAQLLIFAAIFQLSDGLQVAANGALRGFKETSAPMKITLMSYWCIGLPVGIFLGEMGWNQPLGAQGFWIGLVVGLSVAACLLLQKLYFCLKALFNHS